MLKLNNTLGTKNDITKQLKQKQINILHLWVFCLFLFYFYFFIISVFTVYMLFKCCFVARNGAYPENLHVLFCHNFGVLFSLLCGCISF